MFSHGTAPQLSDSVGKAMYRHTLAKANVHIAHDFGHAYETAAFVECRATVFWTAVTYHITIYVKMEQSNVMTITKAVASQSWVHVEQICSRMALAPQATQ